MPWHRRLLVVLSALVPDAERADWRREWASELWYYEHRLHGNGSAIRASAALLWRVGGAAVHALWLRQRLWRRSLAGHDLRHALRMMAARPALTAAVLVTVAIGVGANTAMFSVVDAVLFEPLPFRDPGRLVVVWPERRGSLSRPEYRDVRDLSRSFDGLAAVNARSSFSLTGTGEAARLTGVYASANFFDVLGVDAAVGRTFLPDEDQPGHDGVVVLSDGLWRRRFGGDPSVIGRTLTLYGVPRVVVGVMPRGFAMPSSETELWVPLPLYEQAPGPSWNARYLTLIGRLKPGVAAAEAAEALKPIAAAIKTRWPNHDPDDIVDRGTVASLHEEMVGDTRPTLAALAGATALLLLVACVNIVNLLLARGAGRQRELAVRAALGAGRARLAQQLLVESVTLAVAGGIVGLIGAVWALHAVVPLLPLPLDLAGRVRVDATVLVVGLALAFLTGIAGGIAPAWRLTASRLHDALREGRAPGTAGARRLQRLFTIGQVALATLLLVGAGLLLRSFWRLTHVDPGFDAAHVLAVRLTPPQEAYHDAARRRALYGEVLAGVAQVPGVVTAGAIQHLPLGGSSWNVPVFPEGREIPGGVEPPVAAYRVATPGYFRTMRVRLIEGRGLSADDGPGRPPVTVISDTLARDLWPDGDALGRRLRTVIGDDGWIEVVGVVAGVHAGGLDEPPVGEMYRPYDQDPLASMALVVRTTGEPTRAAAAVRTVVRRVDTNVAVSDVRPLTAVVAASVARPRATAILLLLFAGLALALGAVGVHGVMAYAVSQRTHEFGVRMAVGAQAGAVARLVVGDATMLVASGLVLGLGGAALAARALGSLLFEIRPDDPLTFLAVAGVLGAAGLIAAWLPARRAARVDPVVALRAE